MKTLSLPQFHAPVPAAGLHQRLRRFFYDSLENPANVSSGAYWVRWAVMALVVLSTLSVCLETVEAFSRRLGWFFASAEVMFLAVFSLEYAVRLWCIVESPAYSQPVAGRLRYAVSPLAVVDFLAIAPSVFTLGAVSGFMTLRTLRLIRILRLVKLARYSAAVRSLAEALASKREEIVVILFVLTILLTVASSVMYVVENAAQPDRFSSIPAAMWWGIATATTVGYGDIYPVTFWGKITGALVAVLGAGLFAMPAAIWGAAFVERLVRRRDNSAAPVCPHCGKSYDAVARSDGEQERMFDERST